MSAPFKSSTEDINRCYAQFSPELVYCIGGRYVVPGYTCPHCDSNNPHRQCGSPKSAKPPATSGKGK